MKLSEAKREFSIRCYYWVISEFEKEISTSFPNLRLFKSGRNWQMYQYIQRLKLNDQLAFARALLKQRNREVAKVLNETLTDEENYLLEQFENEFRFQPSSLEKEIDARRRTGEKIKFASKSKLRKVMVAKFIEVFGSQCVKMQTGSEWDPLFYMRYCGWLVLTQFWFGRQQSVLSHRHIIESEARIQHPQNPLITGPAMTLHPAVVWPLSDEWTYITDSEVESTCDAAIKHCRYFFEAAPKLLKGLEFERAVGNQRHDKTSPI